MYLSVSRQCLLKNYIYINYSCKRVKESERQEKLHKKRINSSSISCIRNISFGAYVDADSDQIREIERGI